MINYKSNVNIFHLCSRYHYNVADVRLLQHIEKGNEDGLYISSVASCTNLWALIMDAGTGFTDQVHELSTHFLHKVSTLACHHPQLSCILTVCLIFICHNFVCASGTYMYVYVDQHFPHCCKFAEILTFLVLSEGMDYGTVGEELLYQCYSRSKQWKLLGSNV